MFKWMVKLILLLIASGLMLFTASAAFYYQNSYVPQKENIAAIIKSASNEEQNLSTPARKLLLESISHRSCLMPARSLIYKLDVNHPIDGVLGQHFSMLFWSMFVCHDFNEQQRLTIVASHWPYFSQLNSQGLNVASHFLYKLPLSELSIEQLAHVVACNRGEFVCIREAKRTGIATALLESYYANNDIHNVS
jgi:hypothetical protein